MFPLPLSEVNDLPDDAFRELFKNVVEHAPRFAHSLSDARPFLSVQKMTEWITNILMGLNDEGREEVLKLHPDLADRAQVAELTAESSREQTAAGLRNLASDQSTSISELRARYRSKFGFPFVVCARESTPESITAALRQRLLRSREEELEEGIKQVARISALRITDIVTDE